MLEVPRVLLLGLLFGLLLSERLCLCLSFLNSLFFGFLSGLSFLLLIFKSLLRSLALGNSL